MKSLLDIDESDAAVKEQQAEGPIYFPVGLWKLALMSTCTFGIYDFYWFFKNWDYIRDRRAGINRILRSFFFPYIFNFSLFKEIYQTATQKPGWVESSFLASSWLIFTIVGGGIFPGVWTLFGVLRFLPLLQVQKKINELNLTHQKEFDPNSRLSGWNIAAIVVGGLLLSLMILGVSICPQS